ncbi:10725_t:CDS:2, partial [Cetraspora pellucida]
IKDVNTKKYTIFITSNQDTNEYKNHSIFKVCNFNNFINTFKSVMKWIPINSSQTNNQNITNNIDNNDIGNILRYSLLEKNSPLQYLKQKRKLFGNSKEITFNNDNQNNDNQNEDIFNNLEKEVDSIVDKELKDNDGTIDKYVYFNLRKTKEINFCESEHSLCEDSDDDEFIPKDKIIFKEQMIKVNDKKFKIRKEKKEKGKRLTKKEQLKREVKDLLVNSEDFFKWRSDTSRTPRNKVRDGMNKTIIKEIQDESGNNNKKISKHFTVRNIENFSYCGLEFKSAEKITFFEYE